MRPCKQIIAVSMTGIVMFSMAGCGKGDGQKGNGSKSPEF